MSATTLRDYQPTDMDAVLRLYDEVKGSGAEPVYSLSEVLASCQMDTAVVATQGNDVVGVVVARAAHDQGWIVFITTDSRFRHQGIGDTLLAAAEQRLAPQGLTRLSILVPEAQDNVGLLTKAGFEDKKHLRYFEREIPIKAKEMTVLRELGGRILTRDLWNKIGGMSTEKGLLEARLIVPLADAELAEKYGVEPPRAIMLFGPPGTGKTTFAKAIASRLEWPFIEVFPSRLAGSPEGLAGGLRETFSAIAELEHAVVFIDEVEEIAAQRGGEPPSATQGVTNELLKLIPVFREKPGRILICATNFIRALDSAFLRHGRFDYVIPIGLPDDEARDAIWRGYIPGDTGESLDLPLIVAKTDGFSPADIEYAARKASQRAFERAIRSREDAPGSAPSGSAVTEDYLIGISETRTTVSAEVAEAFREDIETIART